MGSDDNKVLVAAKEGGFNSRSRMGSDVGEPLSQIGRKVSIRAPAWGATRC